MKLSVMDGWTVRAFTFLLSLFAISVSAPLPSRGQVLDLDKLPPTTTGSAANKNPPAAFGASTQPGTGTGAVPAAGNSEGGAAAATTAGATPEPVAPVKPKLPDEVPRPGMPAAMKLYNAGKYALAQKEFEKFINTGVADEATHMNLAYCLYYQRKYIQSLKQFDWVATNAKHNFSMKFKAENTAGAIRTYMRGVCPGNCVKPNDPHWKRMPSLGNGLFYSFPMRDGGTKYFSEGHLGDVVQTIDGVPQDIGP